MTTNDLRTKRLVAGLPGLLICNRARMSRSRLSDIERGYVLPTLSEIERIEKAIGELTKAREHVTASAASVGWPTGRV